ncbi:hypothetical protein [Amycolatopsis sp. cmx-11-12]|uniref:hypothetical protein n=1 Tax=Amycolatopsis sp. cmx-11-12 TaxID=2785795 RepID=UPI0039174688
MDLRFGVRGEPFPEPLARTLPVELPVRDLPHHLVQLDDFVEEVSGLGELQLHRAFTVVTVPNASLETLSDTNATLGTSAARALATHHDTFALSLNNSTGENRRR